MREYMREYSKLHPHINWNDKKKKAQKERYRKNSTKQKKAIYKWRKNNPEKVKIITQNVIKNMAGTYIRKILCEGSGLKHRDIPDSLIELKRAQMKVRRLCRELKTSAN